MNIERVENIESLLELIARSNKSVAEELSLTRENAPGHTAFITLEKLLDKREIKEYYKIGEPVEGCVAIEKAPEEGVFYIERLAVDPDKRHKGLGSLLVNYSLERIKELNGTKASIGIINENIRLKKWYKTLGFRESGIRKFDHLPFTVCFMEYLL